jgi:ribose 1,5-bisphosphokinase PhnN
MTAAQKAQIVAAWEAHNVIYTAMQGADIAEALNHGDTEANAVALHVARQAYEASLAAFCALVLSTVKE